MKIKDGNKEVRVYRLAPKKLKKKHQEVVLSALNSARDQLLRIPTSTVHRHPSPERMELIFSTSTKQRVNDVAGAFQYPRVNSDKIKAYDPGMQLVTCDVVSEISLNFETVPLTSRTLERFVVACESTRFQEQFGTSAGTSDWRTSLMGDYRGQIQQTDKRSFLFRKLIGTLLKGRIKSHSVDLLHPKDLFTYLAIAQYVTNQQFDYAVEMSLDVKLKMNRMV